MTIALRNGQAARGRRIDSSERAKKRKLKVDKSKESDSTKHTEYTVQELRSILYLVKNNIELDCAAKEVLSWRTHDAK